MSNAFKKLLENDCSPFVNVMGASSTFINNKVQEGRTILDNWENLEKLAIAKQKENSQNNQGNSGNTQPQNNPTPFEVLSMGGINKDDIAEIKSCFAECNKIADIGRNYGAENNNDFLTKIANVQTYLGHKGLSTSGSEGCNLVSSLFSVGLGLGKTLLNAIGIETGKLTGFLGKVNGWIELLSSGIASAEDIANRIMSAYSNIKDFVKNIKQNIKDLGNQLKEAIQSELNQLGEILAYNTRMTLASFLGDLANDPCISKVLNNMGTSALKRIL